MNVKPGLLWMVPPVSRREEMDAVADVLADSRRHGVLRPVRGHCSRLAAADKDSGDDYLRKLGSRPGPISRRRLRGLRTQPDTVANPATVTAEVHDGVVTEP